MMQFRNASAPAWLRGTFFLALLAIALPLVPGCATDETPTQTHPILGLDGASSTPMNLAPDFCPDLPPYPVVVIHSQYGDGTLFNIWFWGIEPGYDIATDDTIGGWCLEDNYRPNLDDPGRVTLMCSYDDALPGNLSEMPINELNYLINHRVGDMWDVQTAIWLLTWGSSPSHEPTPLAYQMLDDALTNGADYVPGPGDLVAVILVTGDAGISTEGFQDTFIEMRIPGEPPDEFGGCTPGYWKTHFDRWPEGFEPTDDFDSTFGVDYFDPDITLGEAVWRKGGDLNRLARHGTAALLNAAHGDVEYAYTVGEVIAAVQAGDADLLEAANEDYECVLEGSSADPQIYFE